MRAPHARPSASRCRQPPQLDDRLGVILDAKVADAVDALARLGAAAGALDDERRRLLAALVATGGLPGFERRDEPLDERPDASPS